MYTPQEVSEKTFPKTSRGYNMAAVDEFLDGLTEDYTALYKDNVTLRNKLKLLAEKVEEYRATEDAMRSTLLAAQKMAAQMVAEAQEKKEQILQEARGEAEAQALLLEQQIRDAQARLTLARSETEEYIRRSQELCARQLAFLQELPQQECPQTEPETAPEEVEEPAATEPQETPADWLSGEWEESRPVEEPAPAEEPQPEPVPETDSPFPTDFKLNLEDLQFGRNYNGQR